MLTSFASSSMTIAPQLLDQPARHTHTISLPSPLIATQLIDQIDAANSDVRRSIINALLRYAPAAALESLTSFVAQDIAQQLVALQWNRLPDTVLSNVFSYLTTKQVIQLRRVSSVWNEVGQQTHSFSSCTAKDSILTIGQPSQCNLRGVRAVAVHVATKSLANWWNAKAQPRDCNYYVEEAYRDILNGLHRQGSAIATLVSNRIVQAQDWSTDYQCRLTTVCQSSLANQLRCLDLYTTSHKEDWVYLAKAEPLQRLTEFHSRWENPDNHSWTILTRLVPNLVTLRITFANRTLSTLQPILQLPHLTQLSIKTLHRTNDLGTKCIKTGSAQQLFGMDVPTCRLQHLQLIGDDNFQRSLVEDEEIGLRVVAADVTKLTLYNLEHRGHFPTHLACFRNVTSLELISTSHVLPTHADYRHRLLATLKHLPQLRQLRLLMEDWSTWNSGSLRIDWDVRHHQYEQGPTFSDEVRAAWWDGIFPDNYSRYQPWSAEGLTALFALPLEELTVQCLTPTAGLALEELAAAKTMTLRRLKLGVTCFPYDTVVAVANKLDNLHLPAASRSALPECQPVLDMLPSNITFFDSWND